MRPYGFCLPLATPGSGCWGVRILLAALGADFEHLAAAVGAAVGAGPVGHVELVALRAAAQVGRVDAMMLAAIALAVI